MGILGNKSNWDNRRNKEIIQVGNVKVTDWIPDSLIRESFAVFGGALDQRAIAVDQGIARCYGKMGIVVIHNNDYLEQIIRCIGQNHPNLIGEYPDTPVCIVNGQNPCYEPLLGLDASRTIETIYPEDTINGNISIQQQHLSANGLLQYLNIIQYKNFPISLDNLLYLCGLNMEDLDRVELSTLSPHLAKDISAVLTQDNIAQQVRADLNNFAVQLDGRIWSRYAEPTNISIIEAVKAKGLISIRVPGNNNAINNYLANEIFSLMNDNYPFLLVIDSVNIGQSLLRKAIVNPSNCLSVILSGSSLFELCGIEENDNTGLLSNVQEVILFQCPNVQVAKQYSELVGEYLRKFDSYGENSHKGAFDIFAGHGKGIQTGEQLFARIRPEELVSLGSGAVLIDQVSGKIYRATNFSMK